MLIVSYFSAQSQSTLCQELNSNIDLANSSDISQNTSMLPNNPNSPGNKLSNNGRFIFVQNMVEVTNNIVEFDNCNILMASGAGFIVSSEKTLIFKNCRISALDCTKLWNTIQVKDKGALTIDGNTRVEDAKAVVSAEGNVTLNCINSTYNRNYLGIDLLNISQDAKCLINNNTFTSSSALITPNSTELNPFVSNKILRGIEAKNVFLLDLNNNKFEKLNRGIGLNNTLCNITGGEFKDILLHSSDQQSPLTSQFGVGIDANSKIQTKLIVTGVDFENCERAGIHTPFCSIGLNISRNKFKRIGFFGITTNPNFDNIIAFNTFESTTNKTWRLINFAKATVGSSGKDFINNNIINLPDKIDANSNFAAITFASNSKEPAYIKDNKISGFFPNSIYLTYGINESGSSAPIFITNNLINLQKNNSGPSIGINTEYNKGSVAMQNNRIMGSIDYGIRIVNLSKGSLCSNGLYNCKIGLQISGTTTNTMLTANTFDNNSLHGMRFYDNGINIGSQKHTGNRFFNSDAIHTGFDYKLSSFFVNNLPQSFCSSSVFMPANVSPNDWFKSENGCSPLCSTPPVALVNSDSDIEEYDKEVVHNRLGDYNYTTAQIWVAEYNLYKKIIETPTLKTAQLLDEFYNTTANTNKGDFCKVELKLEQALSYKSSSFDTYVENEKNTLAVLFDSYQTWVNNQSNESFWQNYINAANQYEIAHMSLHNVFQQDVLSKKTLIENAKEINANISPNNLIEINLKTINELFLKFLNEETLSQSDWQTVNQIASICFAENGNATSLAKTLLSWTNNSNYDNVCNNTNTYKSIIKPFKLTDVISVYPNPANQELNVIFHEDIATTSEDLIAIVSDISGKIINTYKLQKNNTNVFDISAYKKGFYIINITGGNETIASKRFIKI